MPILDWLLRANGVGCAIQRQWADLRWLRRPPTGLAARIVTAVELYPCELLFVHRDAETETPDSRQNEIRAALTRATFEVSQRPVCVCVVPVRMQEAWLLFDENAIRQAAGNPSGTVPLQLPLRSECEGLPDPKLQLHRLILDASELGARRRARMRVGQMVRRVAEYIQDFRPLRELQAFVILEHELHQAIRTNGWDRR